jgi:hypothetical protein
MTDSLLTVKDFEFASGNLNLVRVTTAQIKRQMNEQTVEELRADLARQRKALEHKYSPYVLMPREIVRPGTVRAVPLDAKYIRGLDTAGIRSLIVRYGHIQVNDRLNEI